MPHAPVDSLRRVCSAALSHHRARAKADCQVLDYGLAELERLARRSPLCSYCRCPLTEGTLSFDHRVPTSRCADYRLCNLAACCPPCQSAKGLLTADEYMGLRALLSGWPPRAGNDLLARLRGGGKRYRGV